MSLKTAIKTAAAALMCVPKSVCLFKCPFRGLGASIALEIDTILINKSHLHNFGDCAYRFV